MAWLRRETKERRDSERVDVVWTGRCGPLLVVPPTTCYRVGTGVAIAVERLGDTTVGLRLNGRVRHVRTDDDGTHVGIELTFASPQQQRTAEMLFGRGS